MELEDNFSKKLFPDNIIPEQKDIIPETMNIIPDFDRDKKKEKDKKPVVQSHVHEFSGSTRIAGPNNSEHNHRFAGVTSGAIPLPGGNHMHVIFANTDFAISHIHEIAVETVPAIDVGGDKHVHMAVGSTTVDAGHFHEFIVATLIEDPID